MQQNNRNRTWAQAGERWPLFTFICIVLFTKKLFPTRFTQLFNCQSHMADMHSSKIEFKYLIVRFFHLLLQGRKMQVSSAVSLTKWRDDKEGDHIHKPTAALQRTLSKRQIFPMYQRHRHLPDLWACKICMRVLHPLQVQAKLTRCQKCRWRSSHPLFWLAIRYLLCPIRCLPHLHSKLDEGLLI